MAEEQRKGKEKEQIMIGHRNKKMKGSLHFFIFYSDEINYS
jgi:hypothetical protein